jgi:hypothetical protein
MQPTLKRKQVLGEVVSARRLIRELQAELERFKPLTGVPFGTLSCKDGCGEFWVSREIQKTDVDLNELETRTRLFSPSQSIGIAITAFAYSGIVVGGTQGMSDSVNQIASPLGKVATSSYIGGILPTALIVLINTMNAQSALELGTLVAGLAVGAVLGLGILSVGAWPTIGIACGVAVLAQNVVRMATRRRSATEYVKEQMKEHLPAEKPEGWELVSATVRKSVEDTQKLVQGVREELSKFGIQLD